MNVFSKLRNRSLNRALDQFLAEKQASKMPNIQRINSLLIILDESDKSIVKSIENSAKGLFNTNRCGFVILCNEMSDNILQSDLSFILMSFMLTYSTYQVICTSRV